MRTYFENAGKHIAKLNMNMELDNSTKRKRVSTGGAAEDTKMMGLPYAQVANYEVSRMSDSEKLNFLCTKMCAVESLTTQMQNVTERLNQAQNIIDDMSVQMTLLEDKATKAENRLIDLEARSRRNNLIFTNIPEPVGETNMQCEDTLLDFIKNYMRLGDRADGMVFQRVHRLGKKRTGVAPNGDPWRPRPIIAGFRDFKAKENVLQESKVLKGTVHAIQQDFPAEIRTARGKLWSEFCEAKANNQRATIAYPAKLIVEGQVVRDEFPGWNQRPEWKHGVNPSGGQQPHTANNMQENGPTAYTGRSLYRADVNLADYMEAASFNNRRGQPGLQPRMPNQAQPCPLVTPYAHNLATSMTCPQSLPTAPLVTSPLHTTTSVTWSQAYAAQMAHQSEYVSNGVPVTQPAVTNDYQVGMASMVSSSDIQHNASAALPLAHRPNQVSVTTATPLQHSQATPVMTGTTPNMYAIPHIRPAQFVPATAQVTTASITDANATGPGDIASAAARLSSDPMSPPLTQTAGMPPHTIPYMQPLSETLGTAMNATINVV